MATAERPPGRQTGPCVPPRAQELLHILHRELVDPFFRRSARSAREIGPFRIPEYCLVAPKEFGSARRRPVSPSVQALLDEVIMPGVSVLVFGATGWRRLRPYLVSFKLSTVKVDPLPPDVYHMHLDGRPGRWFPRDRTQKVLTRAIFSVVPGECAKSDGLTVYLAAQPGIEFPKNAAFHRYMCAHYEEVGLAAGMPRPLYKIQPERVRRLRPGEVGINPSHSPGGQPVHAEPNPYPENHRYAHMWDFCNLHRPGASGAPVHDLSAEVCGSAGLADRATAASGILRRAAAVVGKEHAVFVEKAVSRVAAAWGKVMA